MVSALLAGQGGLGRWTPMPVRADVATMSLGSTYLVTIVVKRHPRSNQQHQWYPGNMRPPLREQWSEKSPVKCQISESSVLLLLLVAAFYGQWSKILTCQVCVCHWYRLWPPKTKTRSWENWRYDTSTSAMATQFESLKQRTDFRSIPPSYELRPKFYENYTWPQLKKVSFTYMEIPFKDGEFKVLNLTER